MKIALQSTRIPLSFLLLPASLAWAHQPRQERLISVSGSATVQVVPDQVIVTIGVSTVNKDIQKALSKTDESVRNVFAIAEQHGIEKRQVQTDYVGIRPSYEYHDRRPKWLGHEAKQTVALTLSDISKYESLMKALLLGGVNEIRSVRFRTTEMRTHKDRARELAIEAAREKAAAMSRVLGEEIGRVYSILEQPDDAPRYWGQATSNSNMIWTDESGPADGQSTISPGQIAVKAKVTVSFELK